MPLTNYEKQKRWRDKNRAAYNLQQRQRRKNLSGGEKSSAESVGIKTLVETETDLKFESSRPSSIRDAAQNSRKSKIKELEALIKLEQEKPRVEPPTSVNRVYRSETGMVITKKQWEAREQKKNKARSEGFEIDEYAQ